MIKKFIKLRNIGRFKKSDAYGDVELKKYSVLFAENGRGKTTLCAVLRSLQTNDPAYILGRATLGSPDAPEAQLLVDNTTHTFQAGAWDAPLPSIAIFDSTFVAENVFSGDAVDIGHRRSLYRVIVGRRGVELAQRIETLDGDSRTKATEIREKGGEIQVHSQLPRTITLDAFLALAPDDEIDARIDAKTRELEAVRQADQIRNRAALSTATPPVLPADLPELLGRTVENVAADAEARVAAHIAAHGMQAQGERWLAEGVNYTATGDCPFCGQNLAPAAALMQAYNAHFSQAYAALRESIGQMRASVETALGDRQIATFEGVLERNTAGVEFWTRFCPIAPFENPQAPGDALRSQRQAALALLERKASAPLDATAPDAALVAANETVGALQQTVVQYNEGVTAANALIAERKAATGATNVQTVESDLAQLRLIKKRHEADIAAACQAYRDLVAAKAAIEDEKTRVRGELDTYTETVIGRYENTINRYLGDFHAGFSITQTRHAYPGGVASSSYQILINGTPVELGDAATPLNTPSFRNTLSSGDRSTLALAFFLAQLEHDPDRASKVVVFDDPFNSQDGFRKDHTARRIKDCGDSYAQVVVLSHDPGFLGRVWERLDDRVADRRSLELKRIGLYNTSIIPWDIEAALQTPYSADRRVLTDFYHDGKGQPRDVVQKIRPVLETHVKRLGAGVLADNDTLGTIVGKVRTAGAAHQLHPLCDDIDEINVYTRRYMHGENPNWATEPIADGELHGYVRKALEMTGGC